MDDLIKAIHPKKILLTGANGYIGKHILHVLLQQGHEVIAIARLSVLKVPEIFKKQFTVVYSDLLNPELLREIPNSIDVAYYLVHSMGEGENFAIKEEQVAKAFNALAIEKRVRQVIYLSGLSNDVHLSKHLASRLHIEKLLALSGIPLTVFRAGIIIGSGGASFEIIRDLVEILPVMIAPKWINNRCQPISIFDVIFYLTSALGEPKCFNRTFDLGGPEVLTFKNMMLKVAEVRNLRRYIFTVPLLTPRLSAYWLFFVTSTNYQLAKQLVESMRNDTTCAENSINEIFTHTCLSYQEAVKRAFSRISENGVLSSWKDHWNIQKGPSSLNDYIQVPQYGCLQDKQIISFEGDIDAVVEKIWSIGGSNGWYYMNWAWNIRGALDKLVKGVGIRRGRTHTSSLQAGDSLDFWRVVLADKKARRLLLYAEMKLPGEAWLEFHVIPKKENSAELVQTATFRPQGLLGRLYWYAMLPFHFFIFKGMAKAIVRRSSKTIYP